MLMNKTIYRPQLTGFAECTPEVSVVRLPVCLLGSAVIFATIQSSKDFIN